MAWHGVPGSHTLHSPQSCSTSDPYTVLSFSSATLWTSALEIRKRISKMQLNRYTLPRGLSETAV